MTEDEALDLALEALQYIHEGANNQGPHTGISWRCVAVKAEPAIKAIKQARALDKKADNARELGLDYEPVQEPVADAMARYLRVCSSGGMPKKLQESVQNLVYDAERLGYFKAATPPAAQQDIQRLSALVRAQQITIDKLEAAQPAPVQSAERGEPVATKLETQQFNCFHVSAEDFQRLKALPVGAKLYTTPPAAQRQWVGLTPHERMMCRSYDIDEAIANTEAKLKEKNGM